MDRFLFFSLIHPHYTLLDWNFNNDNLIKIKITIHNINTNIYSIITIFLKIRCVNELQSISNATNTRLESNSSTRPFIPFNSLFIQHTFSLPPLFSPIQLHYIKPLYHTLPNNESSSDQGNSLQRKKLLDRDRRAEGKEARRVIHRKKGKLGKFRRFRENAGLWGNPAPFIYHIDEEQIARGDSVRAVPPLVESTVTEVLVVEAEPHLSADMYGIWCVFSVCNLSSFHDGKGNVCFLILTCHMLYWIMYAAYRHTHTYTQPTTWNMLFEYRRAGDTAFTALFITILFPFSALYLATLLRIIGNNQSFLGGSRAIPVVLSFFTENRCCVRKISESMRSSHYIF